MNDPIPLYDVAQYDWRRLYDVAQYDWRRYIPYLITLENERELPLWTEDSNSLGTNYSNSPYRVQYFHIQDDLWAVSVIHFYRDFPAETIACYIGVQDHEIVTWMEERLAYEK